MSGKSRPGPAAAGPLAWARNNILGLVAIFIALSGSAAAATVVIKQDSNGSAKAKASKMAKAGPPGPAEAAKKKKKKTKPGPPGSAGPQGPAGPAGAAGAASPPSVDGSAEQENVSQQLDVGSNPTLVLDTSQVTGTFSGPLDATQLPGANMQVTVQADASLATIAASSSSVAICTLRLDPVGASPDMIISTVYREDFGAARQGVVGLSAVYVGPKVAFDAQLWCHNSNGAGMFFTGGGLTARAEPSP